MKRQSDSKESKQSRVLTRKEAILHWLQLCEANLSFMECTFDIAMNDESRKGMGAPIQGFLCEVAIRFTDTVLDAITGKDDPDFGSHYLKLREAGAYLEMINAASSVADYGFAPEYFAATKPMAGRAYHLLNDVLADLGHDGVTKSVAA